MVKAMTERPILFKGEMVRAILDGRKTQTRRVMKPPPKPTPADFPGPAGHWWPSQKHKSMLGVEREMQKWKGLAGSACPYGDTGDLLWVRETWGAVWPADEPVPLRQCEIEYRADLPPGCTDRPGEWPADEGNGPEVPKWRPSIHMPRWASRITLRITDIRVERLQDITEDDAWAEGCDPVVHPDGAVDCGTRKTTFASLWNKINGPGAWGANPWVWVMAFERVKP
jgi:hypothetical protein